MALTPHAWTFVHPYILLTCDFFSIELFPIEKFSPNGKAAFPFCNGVKESSIDFIYRDLDKETFAMLYFLQLPYCETTGISLAIFIY